MITQAQLNTLEKVLDELFANLKIDIEFTRHFLDRVNDARNKKEITLEELIDIFAKAHSKHGTRIKNMGKGAEAVLNSLRSNINIPFVLNFNKRTGLLELISKTVMRKQGFKTKDPLLKVEGESPARHALRAMEEVLDKPYPFKWSSRGKRESGAWFLADNGVTYNVGFLELEDGLEGIIHDISFSAKKSGVSGLEFDITGSGDALRVFATVLKIILEWIRDARPDAITFDSKERSRTRLYKTLIKKFNKGQFDVDEKPGNKGGTRFVLRRK